jgi:exosome complex component RRP4
MQYNTHFEGLALIMEALTMSESKLLAEPKSIVVPGEEVAQGLDFLPSFGTYRDGNFIRADRVGLVQVEGKVVKLIPIRGFYQPKRGDTIIGRVEELMITGWKVRINDSYVSMLNVKDATSDFINRGADLSQYFGIGDILVCRITSITANRLVDITTRGPGLKKLHGGRIFDVNSLKVPRIIGKQGSMISMIKRATGCQIIVGQNGQIWIDGTPEGEVLATEVIRKIEREAHISGLTETIKEFLEKATGKKLEFSSSPEEEMYQES